MLEQLADIQARFDEITNQLSQPEIISDTKKYTQLTQEHSELQQLVEVYQRHQQLVQEFSENQSILEDTEEDVELKEMAELEQEQLSAEIEKLEGKLKVLLLPKDPNDSKNIILEIRAGTGGDEAALFARDLLRMYLKYAELKGWRTSIVTEHTNDLGGLKEISVSIEGNGVYSMLKFESGVHRVQRVPKTETQGRIHTSAATVAILPEVENVEININPNDIRIDVFRSSGPGGQSVNTTDSAVRITHIPTGLVVSCQNEKSQHKNKAQALKVLRARLHEQEVENQQNSASAQRKQMVGSGDRSERIRTYNFPQGRLTDHRINLTLYRLEEILLGTLDSVIEPLRSHYQAELLKSGNAQS